MKQEKKTKYYFKAKRLINVNLHHQYTCTETRQNKNSWLNFRYCKSTHTQQNTMNHHDKAPHILTSKLDGDRSQCQSPAPGKQALLSTRSSVGGPHDVWMSWQREKAFPCWKSNPAIQSWEFSVWQLLSKTHTQKGIMLSHPVWYLYQNNLPGLDVHLVNITSLILQI
jgi:hypothetical protein